MTTLQLVPPPEPTGATGTRVLRVLIVDDHPLVRTGLSALLGGDAGMDVCAAVGTGEAAVAVVPTLDPDVVLMDLELPGIDGIEATRRLAAQGARASVVVLTSFSDHDRIVNAFEAGAVGYLLKDAMPEEVLAGVRSAADGNSPIAPRAARALVSARTDAAAQALAALPRPSVEEVGVTEREIEVLRLVREGNANKQIARRLGISEATVKAHLTSIFQRIGVRDRTQAALWAHDRGI